MSKSWVPIATKALFLNVERGREREKEKRDLKISRLKTTGF